MRLPTSLNQTQISQLYVSIFGRASEGEGNSYWQAQSDMTTAAVVMLDTDVAWSYFGANLNTNQAFSGNAGTGNSGHRNGLSVRCISE